VGSAGFSSFCVSPLRTTLRVARARRQSFVLRPVRGVCSLSCHWSPRRAKLKPLAPVILPRLAPSLLSRGLFLLRSFGASEDHARLTSLASECPASNETSRARDATHYNANATRSNCASPIPLILQVGARRRRACGARRRDPSLKRLRFSIHKERAGGPRSNLRAMATLMNCAAPIHASRWEMACHPSGFHFCRPSPTLCDERP
jgi:hypothetical protein